MSAATLWEAFTAAQADFGPLIKSTTGARASQKYAALDAVLDAVRPVLNKHGLVLTQPPMVDGDTLFIRTMIVHKATGEAHECIYPAGPVTTSHQLLGAGVTYARRYSILSLLGVFPENEDDDGEKAGAAGGERAPAQTPPRQQLNSSQAKKADAWPRFVDKLKSFGELSDLEEWWARATTAQAVSEMPIAWQEQATEEYEKAQERLAEKLRRELEEARR